MKTRLRLTRKDVPSGTMTVGELEVSEIRGPYEEVPLLLEKEKVGKERVSSTQPRYGWRHVRSRKAIKVGQILEIVYDSGGNIEILITRAPYQDEHGFWKIECIKWPIRKKPRVSWYSLSDLGVEIYRHGKWSKEPFLRRRFLTLRVSQRRVEKYLSAAS